MSRAAEAADPSPAPSLGCYSAVAGRLQRRTIDLAADPGAVLPEGALWIDLLHPTPRELDLVGRTLGFPVPPREELQEIEASSRLYVIGDVAFMTASVVHLWDAPHPRMTTLTFILCRGRLVTLRWADPRPLQTAQAHAARHPWMLDSAPALMLGLLDAVVGRTADILERTGATLDALSQEVFDHGRSPGNGAARKKRRPLAEVLVQIGQEDERTSKARESLVSIGRLLAFYQTLEPPKPARPRLKQILRDADSLTDHAAFISHKTGLLLDATLGMINIEQTGIIKIFSVVAAVFLPPTLIASIYGMNFHWMPELGSPFGYPLAIVAMLASAVLPYWFFKRRGWL